MCHISEHAEHGCDECTFAPCKYNTNPEIINPSGKDQLEHDHGYGYGRVSHEDYWERRTGA